MSYFITYMLLLSYFYPIYTFSRLHSSSIHRYQHRSLPVHVHTPLSSSQSSSSSSSSSNPKPNEDPKLRSKEWAALRGLEPGYGGIWPGDSKAPTVRVTFRSKASGQEYSLDVPKDRYIYFAFEEAGIELPVINQQRMCRQGCCTTCACKLVEGKVDMDNPLGLLKEMRREGYVLTCCSYPVTDCVLEVQSEDEIYIKQWAEGFEGGGVEWGGFLPEEDG